MNKYTRAHDHDHWIWTVVSVRVQAGIRITPDHSKWIGFAEGTIQGQGFKQRRKHGIGDQKPAAAGSYFWGRRARGCCCFTWMLRRGASQRVASLAGHCDCETPSPTAGRSRKETHHLSPSPATCWPDLWPFIKAACAVQSLPFCIKIKASMHGKLTSDYHQQNGPNSSLASQYCRLAGEWVDLPIQVWLVYRIRTGMVTESFYVFLQITRLHQGF